MSENVTQLPALQQRLPNICGFHALNGVMVFDERKTEKLLDEVLFVENYNKTK